MASKTIKSTKYCNIISQAKVYDEEYTYCIERIFVKSKRREKIRFSLYKDTMRSSNRYITKGINEIVDIRLQIFMWRAIDGLKDKIVGFEKGTFESKYKCVNYKKLIHKYIKNENLQITKISTNDTTTGKVFRVRIIDNSNGKELTGHSSDMIKFTKDLKSSFTNDLTCFMYFGEEKGNIRESKTFDKNYFMPGEIMVNEELEKRANVFESDEYIVSLSICGDIVLNISSYNKNEILKDNIKK